MLSPDDRLLINVLMGLGVGQIALLLKVVMDNATLQTEVKELIRRINILEGMKQ